MDKKILMLVDGLSMTNGVSMTARELYKNWGTPDWKLSVYGTGDKQAEYYESEKAMLEVATTPVRMAVPIYRDIRLSFPVIKTQRYLQAHHNGIIHAATPGPLGVRGYLFARVYGIPLVTTHHTRMTLYAQLYMGKYMGAGADSLINKVMQLMYEQSHMTVVHSYGAGEEAQSLGAKNVVYVPMGIPVPHQNESKLIAEKKRARAAVKEKYGLKEDDPILLSVGRLSIEKSIDILIEAAEILKLPFIFAGDGPLRGAVKKSSHVIGVGMVHGQELADLYLAADFFVSASITETLGRIFFEALAYGTPIILPNSGQQDSLLPNNCPPIIKYHRNSDEVGLDNLVNGVRQALALPERENLVAPALFFAKEFSWENVAYDHMLPYEHIYASQSRYEKVSI